MFTAVKGRRPEWSKRPELTVISPLFNEAENVGELHGRLTATLRDLDIDYELIFVNDGSSDSTADQLTRLQQSDDRIVIVHLSRNFGHQSALSAGLEVARGRAVALLDGDLQDPPELLGQFLAAWREGFEVVYAVRRRRPEGILKRTAYWAFYRVLRIVSDCSIPLDSGDFCLMDRRVVRTLRKLPERDRFVRGLRAFVGFRQCGIPYDRSARSAGTSKYTFSKLFELAASGLINFSTAPLRLLAGLTAGSFVVALALLAYALASRPEPPTWLLPILVMSCMGAIQLAGLTIIAEYIRRIFIEVKGRPTYIIRNVQRARRPSRVKHEHKT